MARQTALSTIRSMLKAEVGHSLTVGTQKDSTFNTLIANMQTWLAAEYDWPFLEDRWDVTVGNGTRYFTIPTTSNIRGASTYINFERPVTFHIKWARLWQPIVYGISRQEYNYIDSDRGMTQDPVMRWQMADQDKVEIWPMPAAPQQLRFWGQRMTVPLAADADKADLDDVLLVLFCAAELLANAGLPNASIVLAKAQQRLARLRGVYPARQQSYIIGQGSDRNAVRLVPMKIVAIHG